MKFDEELLRVLQPYNDTDCEYKRYGDANEGGYVACQNFFKYSDAFVNVGIEGRDKLGC